jgi:hypothetical protein
VARRRLLTLAVVGVALVASAAGLAVTRGSEETPGPAEPVQVGGHAPGDLVRAASTPVLAVDPMDPSRVLLANRIERPRFSCSVFASDDGGTTWSASDVRLPAVGDRCYAPAVAFDRDGRAFLLVTMLEGRGNEPWGAFLFRSNDGGKTFGPGRRVLPRFSFQTGLAPSADGFLSLSYVSGTEFSRHATFGLGPPPNPVAVAVSRPHATGLSPPRWASAPALALVGGPVLVLGPGEAVYVLYWDYRDDVFDYYAFPGRYGGRFRLLLAASHDGGQTFAQHVVEPSVVPTNPFLVYLPPLPALAVDRESGAIFAAWEDGRSGSSDVLMRASHDGGVTWTPAHILLGGAADERMPALAVADGRLVAVAYRISAGRRGEVAVRASSDMGRTFSAPAALTPDPFDSGSVPTLPNHPDLIDLGSKLALAVAGTEMLASWVDTRAGSAATGKVDVFVRRVPSELPEPAALPRAGAPPPPQPSRADRRLRGGCLRGPRIDSRSSPLAVVRSFVSALDRGETARAYGYLDRRWRRGRGPVRAPHPFREFRSRYRSLSCLRIAAAESYDRSEDGKWNTFRLWAAARRENRPTRLLFGLVWTHSDTAGPPWSIIGVWTREVGASGRAP